MKPKGEWLKKFSDTHVGLMTNPQEPNAHGSTPPSYPGDDHFDEIWQDLIQVRMQVSSGVFPHGLVEKYLPAFISELPEAIYKDLKKHHFIPETLRDLIDVERPQDAIWLVVGDLESKWSIAYKNWLVKRGHRPKGYDPTVQDDLCLGVDFHENIADVGKRHFRTGLEAKYAHDRIRPQDHAEVNLEWNEALIEVFFPQKNPKHPEAPHNHGVCAAATIAYVNSRFDGLDVYEATTGYLIAWWISFLRFMLGVHFPDSVQMSMEIGGLHPG